MVISLETGTSRSPLFNTDDVIQQLWVHSLKKKSETKEVENRPGQSSHFRTEKGPIGGGDLAGFSL